LSVLEQAFLILIALGALQALVMILVSPADRLVRWLPVEPVFTREVLRLLGGFTLFWLGALYAGLPNVARYLGDILLVTMGIGLWGAMRFVDTSFYADATNPERSDFMRGVEVCLASFYGGYLGVMLARLGGAAFWTL
jgi:hypothetical protein